jgi:acyl-CoA-binding protein
VSSRARSSVDALIERPITDRLVRIYKIYHVRDDLEDGGADGVSRER